MSSCFGTVQVCSHGKAYGLTLPPDLDEPDEVESLTNKGDKCKQCLYVDYFMWKELYDAVFKARTVSNAASVNDALRYIKDSLECFHLFQGHHVHVCKEQDNFVDIGAEMKDDVLQTKWDGTQVKFVVDWLMNWE